MSGAERLWRALEVPEGALVDRRVPKARLIEGAELSPSDRRLVEAAVERIDWRATLRPATTGIPAGTDLNTPCAEIVVLLASLRAGAKASRLAEILHRAVTAPLVLLVDADDGGRLAVGLKRAHGREGGRLVPDRLALAPPVGAGGPLDPAPDGAEAAFVASLALARLPGADLRAAQEALEARAEAFAAAREGVSWRLPATRGEAEARRAALGRVGAERAMLARLRREARAAKALAERVALGHQSRAAEAALAQTLAALS